MCCHAAHRPAQHAQRVLLDNPAAGAMDGASQGLHHNPSSSRLPAAELAHASERLHEQLSCCWRPTSPRLRPARAPHGGPAQEPAHLASCPSIQSWEAAVLSPRWPPNQLLLSARGGVRSSLSCLPTTSHSPHGVCVRSSLSCLPTTSRSPHRAPRGVCTASEGSTQPPSDLRTGGVCGDATVASQPTPDLRTGGVCTVCYNHPAW